MAKTVTVRTTPKRGPAAPRKRGTSARTWTLRKMEYCRLSGRPPQIVNDQAKRYGLPIGGKTIDLGELLPALHDFLARYSDLFTAEDGNTDNWAMRHLKAKVRRDESRANRERRKDHEEAGALVTRADAEKVVSRLADLFVAGLDRVVGEANAVLSAEAAATFEARVNEIREELAHAIEAMDGTETADADRPAARHGRSGGGRVR